MRKIFRLCGPALKKHTLTLGLYIIMSTIASSLSLLYPYISGNFVDSLIECQDKSFIFDFAIMYLVIGFFSLFIGYCSAVIYAGLQPSMSYMMAKRVISHMHRLPFCQINTMDPNYLTQKVQNDVSVVVTYCIGLIQNVIINAVLIIAPMSLLIKLNAGISISILSVVLIYILIYGFLRKRLFSLTNQFLEAQALYHSKLTEQFRLIKFIKQHAKVDEFQGRLSESFKQVRNTTIKTHKLSYCFTAADKFITIAFQIFVFIIGGQLVIEGTISVGYFTMISSYFSIVFTAVRYYFSLAKSTQETLVSWSRLDNILKKEVQKNGTIKLVDVNDVVANNMSFSFERKNVLTNISFHFTTGKIYGICGVNGAGKSTILNLLTGIYESTNGDCLFFDGHDIQELDVNDFLSKHVSVLEQPPVVIDGTIKSNILFDNPSCSMQEIRDLSQMIGLLPFVQSLENGFDTKTNELGSNISGGEKQKIALVRVLASKKRIVLLDEPTSAIDEDSKTQLLEFLKKYKSEHIVVIVTHDREILSECDELIELCGTYSA